MPRLDIVAAALSATLAAAQSPLLGASLSIEWCDAAAPLQQWLFNADGTIALLGNATLCIANAANTSLVLTRCDGATRWHVGPPYVYGDGAYCFNDQWGSPVQGPGGKVKLWPCSDLSFNSYFTRIGAAQLMANYTQAGNTTLSQLCVTAVPPAQPPLPTAAQAAWQDSDVGCFVHWNMASMVGSQGCGGGAPPPISAWAPTALDTDGWVDTCKAMGGTRIVYVAKHGCGFAAWRSNVTTAGYAYDVTHSPAPDVDVVAHFVASARKKNLGIGFYYSVVSNAYCNVQNGAVQPGPINPSRQLNVTQAQYEDIVIGHLSELYSTYGPLEEVWFDGGYPTSLLDRLKELFASLQPNVVAFQGERLVPSPVRWVGTESGLAPYPCWSTCDYDGSGAGDPDAGTWFPAETDFTLQNGDNWFYSPTAGVHTPSQLRTMYETSAGHNTALIVDIAPFANGSVPVEQSEAAAALGRYVAACYGAPVSPPVGGNGSTLTLPLGGTAFDRIVVREDIRRGQLVRAFSISARMADGSIVAVVAAGSSIGNKFIYQGAAIAGATELMLDVSAVAAGGAPSAPFIRNFAAYSCGALAAEADARWAEKWGGGPGGGSK